MTSLPPLDAVDAVLQAHFGHAPARASVSFVGVDPIEVLRFHPAPDEVAYVTLGMARHPMTPASAEVAVATDPRAELLLRVRQVADADDEAWRQLAVLGAAPAVEGVVYRTDMTVDLGQPLARGSRCTGALVTSGSLPPVTTAVGPVDILRVVPATATELAWARVRGSAALRARWDEYGTDLLDLSRPAVPLD